jgi:very-short-patch-repair endonuclease/predicted transcriptional regulator of viral defense system
MACQTSHSSSAGLWALAKTQHGVVSTRQLLELGLSRSGIAHRIARGRLHAVHRGVYAVGRPELTRFGAWMASVLACGPAAALSHDDAGALWGVCSDRPGDIHVSLPPGACRRRRAGIVVHRRPALGGGDVSRRHGIPVTTPICTLVDLAARLTRDELEAAVNEADKRGLTDPEELRAALGAFVGRPGVGVLRDTLDRRTFTLTDSQLERRFLPIARKAGLPLPETGKRVSGFRVDFHWPELGLVVETDGLRYHRTPAQQAKDRLRDQAHAAAGLVSLRFTRAQVRFEPDYVQATLAAVARRLGEG